MRFKQVKTTGSQTTTTYYVGKGFEREITTGGHIMDKTFVQGHTTLYKTVAGTPNYPSEIVHSLLDRLGSPSTLISGGTGTPTVIRYRAHGVFGRPVDAGSGSILANAIDWDSQTRGFTGHEHMVEQALINMNGRIYDYNLGRFMSVDPFIQTPQSSQSINPYSYIMNNPMSGTDPTGYQSQNIDNSAQYKDTDVELANKSSGECVGDKAGCSPSITNGESDKGETQKPIKNKGKIEDKVEKLTITCDAKCQDRAKEDADFRRMLDRWKLKSMQENQTHWVRGPTGNQQTRRGAIDELIYGSGAQLADNQCGMGTILVCTSTIFMGGEIPKELQSTLYKVADKSEETTGIAEKVKDAVGSKNIKKIPIGTAGKVVKNSLSLGRAYQICEAACDAKNKTIF